MHGVSFYLQIKKICLSSTNICDPMFKETLVKTLTLAECSRKLVGAKIISPLLISKKIHFLCHFFLKVVSIFILINSSNLLDLNIALVENFSDPSNMIFVYIIIHVMLVIYENKMKFIKQNNTSTNKVTRILI